MLRFVSNVRSGEAAPQRPRWRQGDVRAALNLINVGNGPNANLAASSFDDGQARTTEVSHDDFGMIISPILQGAPPDM